MVGYLGYSPAGLERLRALVTDASERCAMFASGTDAVQLPDGVITPDVGALTRLQHTLQTHFRSSIEAILASDAMTAIATTVSIVRILVDRPEVRARVGLAAVPAARWSSLATALQRADAAEDVDQRDRALADVDRVIDNDLHLSTYVARVTTTASLTWS